MRMLSPDAPSRLPFPSSFSSTSTALAHSSHLAKRELGNGVSTFGHTLVVWSFNARYSNLYIPLHARLLASPSGTRSRRTLYLDIAFKVTEQAPAAFVAPTDFTCNFCCISTLPSWYIRSTMPHYKNITPFSCSLIHVLFSSSLYPISTCRHSYLLGCRTFFPPTFCLNFIKPKLYQVSRRVWYRCCPYPPFIFLLVPVVFLFPSFSFSSHILSHRLFGAGVILVAAGCMRGILDWNSLRDVIQPHVPRPYLVSPAGSPVSPFSFLDNTTQAKTKNGQETNVDIVCIHER